MTRVLWTLALGAVAVGCQPNVKREVATSIWSDDEQEILVVVDHLEEGGRAYDDSGRWKRVGYELWRVELNGTTAAKWVEGEGAAGKFHFSRRGGYALFQNFGLVRLGVDGSRVKRPTGDRMPFPSPGGSVIAEVVEDCSAIGDGMLGCSIFARFLDPVTLEETGRSLAHESTRAIQERADDPHSYWLAMWNLEGDAVLMQETRFPEVEGVGPVLAFRPGESPVEVPPLDCEWLEPRTAGSSSINSQGQSLWARLEDGVPVVDIIERSEREHPTLGWPTRCYPEAR